MHAPQVGEVSSEHRLLLSAALSDTASAAAAWRTWRSCVDFDEIDGAAQRLLPLIVRRPYVVPTNDPVRGRVRGMYRQTWVHNHRLWANVQSLLDALDAEDVPVMALKGIALLPFYGDDWGVRPMYDVDIVVPFDQRDTALRALSIDGWTAETGQSSLWISKRMARHRHAWGHERGDPPHLDRVDVHWRVSPAVLWGAAQQQWWRHARTIDVAGRPTSAIGPVELLVHVLLHGTTGDLQPPVQWVVDAVHVARVVVTDATLLEQWSKLTRVLDLVGVLRTALDRGIAATGDESLIRLRDTLPRRRSLIDRARTWSGPGAEYVSQVARAASGGAGLRRGLIASVERMAEIDVVTHPRLAMFDTVIGSPVSFARLRRRFVGVLTRPPQPSREVDLPCLLDLTVPDTLDRHAGPGWRMVSPEGANTFGRTSSLVLTSSAGQIPEELELEMRSIDGSVDVTVVVDGRRVGTALVGPTSSTYTMSLRRRRSDDPTLEIRLDTGRRRGGLSVSAVRVR